MNDTNLNIIEIRDALGLHDKKAGQDGLLEAIKAKIKEYGRQ